MRSESGAAAVVLDGGPLHAREVEGVARHAQPVAIGPGAAVRVAASRRGLEGVIGDGEPHYGVNTGFGSFARKRIPNNDLRALQRNLVRSHAAGIGAPLPDEVVRGMMLLLTASLCRGCSGVRPVVVDAIVGLLNAGVTPVVPEIGSCGASGDLAPLAHMALVLIGEGEAVHAGRRMAGREALAAAGLEPVTLEAKEGLALINGTHLMGAQGALLACDFGRVFDAALTGAAMSIDACRATDSFLDPRVYAVRNQPGAASVAERLRGLLAGSEIVRSHRQNDPRVQDPYSLRCAPQVLGSAWDAAGYVKLAVERELGAVTDNPLVFGGGDGEVAKWQSGEVAKNIEGSDQPPPHTQPLRHSATQPLHSTPAIVSAGNFHGMPIALPLDVLAIALCHIAGIAERRVYHLLSGFDPDAQVPAFLSPLPGLHSGLMIAQYTAAACCNELIGLANPASVANLSTSAGMEDYNSWGPRSAAKARRGMELTRTVVAIELLCAAEGLEYHRPLRSGEGVERGYAAVRGVVARLTEDRPPAPDIALIAELIAEGAFGGGA